MPRWFAHVATWSLILAVLFIGIPRAGNQPLIAGDTSSEFRALSQRLDRLERDNRRLRESLEHYRRLSDRVDRIEVTGEVPAEGMPLRLFDVPETVTFCGERLPFEIPEVHRRFEEEWYRFLVNRHWVLKWHRRSRDAFPVIERELAERGLPDDLKFVMVIESGVEPRARSGAGAVGWWQFMPGTAGDYGLHTTRVVDDRRDLERATEAALDYMEDLYEEFENWPLVLAAYNSGDRRVRETIEHQVTRDYYDMVLPRETEAYWFKAAAAKVLLSEPARYQLELPDDGWAPVACDTLGIRVQRNRVPIKDLIASAGITYRELKRLNPSFRTTYLPKGEHRVVVPTDRTPAFVSALDNRVRLLGRRTVGPEEAVDLARERPASNGRVTTQEE